MQGLLKDGWHPDSSDSDTELQSGQSFKKLQQPLSILQANQHSLEPDMVTGWRPKLPSCPLPLSYTNTYVDTLLGHLRTHDDYSIAYVGPRYVNSVQVNQKYSYYWKYRQRYSMSLDVVQEAVKNIGREEQHKPIKIQTKGYTFDSAFESGNLDLVVRVSSSEYDCFMRSDTNTKGHTNWYYFKVSNNAQVGTIKINICNMTKNKNLYSKGMKPYVRQGEQGEWAQESCGNVLFMQKLCRYGFDVKTYQLQFTYTFTEPEQCVYFAYSVPYTYSNLQAFVKQITTQYPHCVKSQRFCESLGGLDLPILTISNLGSANSCSSDDRHHRKRIILISARIHPGESNSSHVLQGLVRALLQDNQNANNLRRMFVFYVVPMLNPDGVVAGNFRTSYSGKDLNRQFHELSKYVYPQITAMSEFCRRLRKMNSQGVDFYIDFHGHSAKKNMFCYGPDHPATKLKYFKARAFAKIIEKTTPIFNYKKSIFTITEGKKHTARAYMLRQMKIPMTFTFQVSNGLYEDQLEQDVYLNRAILHEAGAAIVRGLYRYALIEMRMPTKTIKPKVDTGNIKSRAAGTNSGKNRVQSMNKKLGQALSPGKQNKKNSVLKVSSEQDKELLALMKQLKKQQKQQMQNGELEGGSDSESEGEDLTKQESKNLFQHIVRRHQVSNGYQIKTQKKSHTSSALARRKQNEYTSESAIKQVTVDEARKLTSAYMVDSYRPAMNSTKNLNKRGVSIEYEKVVLPQKTFLMMI